MELAEAAQLIGTGLATFAATWAAFVQRLEKKVSTEKDRTQQLEAKLELLEQQLVDQGKHVATLQANTDNQKENHEELKKRHEKTTEELRKTVTVEEFGAYTRQVITSVNGLTERVGRIMGALDASE